MSQAVRRILQITLGTVAGLLIIPVAVNVGTGGEAPRWLQPYAGLLWPVAIMCVLLIIALEIWDKIPMSKDSMSARRPHDRRNTSLALGQILRYLEDRQSGSLP